MRIVVTGGTGFIGREVVKRLLETPGDEVVVVTTRSGAADSVAKGAGFLASPLSETVHQTVAPAMASTITANRQRRACKCVGIMEMT